MDIFTASFNNDVKFLNAILKHKSIDVNLNQNPYGLTALIIACSKGNVKIIQELLKHKLHIILSHNF